MQFLLDKDSLVEVLSFASMKTGFQVVKMKQYLDLVYFTCFSIRLGEKCRRPYMR